MSRFETGRSRIPPLWLAALSESSHALVLLLL
jgi:hypothetical protein